MTKSVCMTLLLLIGFQAFGQTFADCANNYHSRFNSINLQRFKKEISHSRADSLRTALELGLDSCILGKELDDYRLIGHSGKIFTNESLKGKVVMFNFWSVNCGPCIGEIPVLNKLKRKYRDSEDFVLISILLEKQQALENFLLKGLTRRSVDYEFVSDSKALMKSTFKWVKAYPTNVFLDREGKVYFRKIGGIVDPKDEAELEQQLESIINRELIR